MTYNHPQVFTKEFFFKHQHRLLWLANTAVGRKLLCIDPKLPKLIAILPNSVHWETSTTKRGKKLYCSEFTNYNIYRKKLHRNFYWIWKIIHEFDMNFANPIEKLFPAFPSLNLGFDTLTAYPDYDPETTTVNGYIERAPTSEIFSTIRGGVHTLAVASTDLQAALSSSSTSNQFNKLSRSIFLFNTSSLTTNATISSGVIAIRGYAKQTGVGAFEVDIVSSTVASNTNIATGDSVGATPFSSVASGSLITNGYVDFTLDANGIANISKTGVSKFGMRLNWDTDDSFTGTWASNSFSWWLAYGRTTSGTSTAPKLTVTYTLPATATGNFFMFF